MNDIDKATYDWSMRILKFKDPKLSYQFLKSINLKDDVWRHSSIVISSGNLEYNYLFARDIKDADIESHAKVIIFSGNPKYNYLFARDVKGADITKHGDVVINSRDPKYNYLFIKDIKGANVKRHLSAIIKSKNKEYLILAKELIETRESHKKI